ncbi:MAG TPA: phosphatase PAP2 family protein [Candidatus Limosilactobacillus merdigallinarum]|uniref:Phosphatase PAP2 family protein n=1 Tax=Candidatus Limosilactobacillus merdigallinarum TaxID=2838652 RepID=A0A9D1VJJ0_9LACO|nr:phosphatase PAP2 family protein [Candidatus Limosilactobacillus merdigallinarum]
MNKRTSQWLFIISLIIFLILLGFILIVPQQLTRFDTSIRLWVNNYHAPLANAFWRQYTSLFNAQASFTWACGISLLAFLTRDWHLGLQISISIFGGIMLNHLIKIIVRRPRPFTNVLMHYSGFSFPSGHSLTAVLVFGSIMIITSRWVHHQGWQYLINGILIVLILMIGFSRVFVGAHYPSDVLAGWSLGVVILTGLNLVTLKINQLTATKN